MMRKRSGELEKEMEELRKTLTLGNGDLQCNDMRLRIMELMYTPIFDTFLTLP